MTSPVILKKVSLATFVFTTEKDTSGWNTLQCHCVSRVACFSQYIWIHSWIINKYYKIDKYSSLTVTFHLKDFVLQLQIDTQF